MCRRIRLQPVQHERYLTWNGGVLGEIATRATTTESSRAAKVRIKGEDAVAQHGASLFEPRIARGPEIIVGLTSAAVIERARRRGRAAGMQIAASRADN